MRRPAVPKAPLGEADRGASLALADDSQPVIAGARCSSECLSGRNSSHPGTLTRVSDAFPSLKARRLLAILLAKPLEYRIVRQSGSHRRLEAKNYPPLTFSFHDNATIPSGQVRTILVKQIGLDADTARGLI